MPTKPEQKYKRDPQTSVGVFFYRMGAVVFALILFICLPMLYAYITMMPEAGTYWDDAFEVPMDALVKGLAVIIGGGILLGIVITARNLRK